MPYIGNITSDFSIDTGNITNRAVTATKLSPSSVGSNGQVLSVDGSGNLQWSADASGTALSGSTNNTITTVTGANAIQGEPNLTFDGSALSVTGSQSITDGSTAFITSTFASNYGKLDVRGTDIANSNHYLISYGAGHGDHNDFHLVNLVGKLVLRTASTKTVSLDAGNLFFNTTASFLGIDTADGSDNKYIAITGGGAVSQSRGATLVLYGNEEPNFGGRLSVQAGNIATGYIRFATGGTESMRIAYNGKVAIGTSIDPSDKLHIDTTGTSAIGLLLKATDDYYPRITGDANRTGADTYLLHLHGKWNGTSVCGITLESGDDTTNKDDGRIAFRTASAGTPLERMRIDRNGYVGINTGEGNAPVDHLHINTTGIVGTGLTLKSTDNNYSTINGNSNRTSADTYLLNIVGSWNNTTVAQITLESGDDTTNKDDGRIGLWTAAAGGSMVEHLRITPSGRIGIKTSGDPTDIPGTSHDTVVIGTNTATSGGITINGAADANFGYQFYDQNGASPCARLLWLGDTDRAVIATKNAAASGDDYKMEFAAGTNNGVKVLTGNLAFDDGYGIDFSLTGNGSGTSSVAELFNDYEEGVFTPGIDFDTNGTRNQTETKGTYRKIGNWVYWNALVGVSKGTASGNMRITGMPYASSTHANTRNYCDFYYNDGWVNVNGRPWGYQSAGNSTACHIYHPDDSGVWNGGHVNVTADNLGASATFRIGGYYPTGTV